MKATIAAIHIQASRESFIVRAEAAQTARG